jgi:hypothetical protein
VLAVGVGAHDVLAGALLDREPEAGPQRRSLPPVGRVGQHRAAEGPDGVEHRPVGGTAAVVDDHDGSLGRRGAQGVDEGGQPSVGFVGGDEHDHGAAQPAM